jgi:hypothetical protein
MRVRRTFPSAYAVFLSPVLTWNRAGAALELSYVFNIVREWMRFKTRKCRSKFRDIFAAVVHRKGNYRRAVPLRWITGVFRSGSRHLTFNV